MAEEFKDIETNEETDETVDTAASKEPAKETKTVSKDLYDAKVAELSKMKKQLKALETQSAGANENAAKVASLEKQLTQEKINNQLILKLSEMGCQDTEYALYKIHRQNPDLALEENGKIGNIAELVEGVKTTNPGIFNVTKEVEIEPSELGKGEQEEKHMTKADFLRKPYAERASFEKEHPEEYQSIMRGE